MALLNLWNPTVEFTSIRDAVNRLLDQAFVRPFAADVAATVPFDLIEQRDAVVVRAAAPGLDPTSIGVMVQQGVLTITGRRTLYTPEEAKRYMWHVRSLPEGEFRLTTSVPFEVDVDHAQASYEQGIITVTLPKAEAIRPRVIQVKTVEGQKALAAGVS